MLDLPVLVTLLTRDRLGVITPTLKGWEFFKDYADVKILFRQWNDYLNLPKESLTAYDALKLRIKLILSEESFDWILMHTTFLTRNAIMDKRCMPRDRVFKNTIDLIKYYEKNKG